MTPPSVVFLDRDGTIVRDVAYLSRADQVELLDGAADAIRHLNEAGIPVIVVTNQSGIARGYFTVADYESGRARLNALLKEHGAHIDASYYCPHLPGVTGKCDCRKPATGLFHTAAREHELDMSNPAFVGDRWRDVAPVCELGGSAFLLQSDSTDLDDLRCAREAHVTVVPSLARAVEQILSSDPTSPASRTRRARIAVLASGTGSNLQAILDHFASMGEARSGDVVLAASNRADAGALARARNAGVATASFDGNDADAIIDVLERYAADIVALAGYVRLIPEGVVEHFSGRILNVHPGPLPRFGGRGMYGARVHDAVLASGETQTAVTVHLVDAAFDHGEVLARWPVPVHTTDTADSLAARVLAAEHIVYPRILDAFAATVASLPPLPIPHKHTDIHADRATLGF